MESIDFVDFQHILLSIESLTNTNFSSNCFISEMSQLCLINNVSILLISLLLILVQFELHVHNAHR